MSPRIVLCRHGQTHFNRSARIQGQSDSPLTEVGLEEILKLAEIVKAFRPFAIYSSSLGRAAYSSGIYSQVIGIPVYFRSSLVELSCGEWETCMRKDVIGPEALIRSSWIDRPPGGESYEDAENRLRTFIHEINLLEAGSPVMVLAHSGLNRVLAKSLLGISTDEALNIKFPHDTIYEIHEKGFVRWAGLSTGSGSGFLREK